MYAFGSACSEHFNIESDLDFLISFENLAIEQYTDNYFDLHYKLEKLFNRKIVREMSLCELLIIKR